MPLGTCIKKLLLRKGQHTQTQQNTADTENFVILSQYLTMKKSHLEGLSLNNSTKFCGRILVLTVQLHLFTFTGTTIFKTSEKDSL